MACNICDGSCAGSSFDGLLVDDLGWLWDQLASAADRRGDPLLTTGWATVTVPDGVDARASGVGLLGRQRLAPGQRLKVDLAELAARLYPLTPGVVTAHAIGRRLAMRAEERATRQAAERDVRRRLDESLTTVVEDDSWAALRRTGWVTRLVSADDPALLEKVAAIIANLPLSGEPPIDRRRLAHDATGDPHDLDTGRVVAGLSLAILAATGKAQVGGTSRATWASVGVLYDDIIGGLTLVGLAPAGWTVPDGAPVTVPPRVLANCDWPRGGNKQVFVTENPSVLGAATDVDGARVVCTSGTPSRSEVDALSRLAERGWQLQVRADFDDAGLGHVAAILAAARTATPWRMGASNYSEGLERSDSTVALRVDRLPPTPWEPELAVVMADHGLAVFEECFLDELIGDIASA